MSSGGAEKRATHIVHFLSKQEMTVGGNGRAGKCDVWRGWLRVWPAPLWPPGWKTSQSRSNPAGRKIKYDIFIVLLTWNKESFFFGSMNQLFSFWVHSPQSGLSTDQWLGEEHVLTFNKNWLHSFITFDNLSGSWLLVPGISWDESATQLDYLSPYNCLFPYRIIFVNFSGGFFHLLLCCLTAAVFKFLGQTALMCSCNLQWFSGWLTWTQANCVCFRRKKENVFVCSMNT